MKKSLIVVLAIAASLVFESESQAQCSSGSCSSASGVTSYSSGSGFRLFRGRFGRTVRYAEPVTYSYATPVVAPAVASTSEGTCAPGTVCEVSPVVAAEKTTATPAKATGSLLTRKIVRTVTTVDGKQIQFLETIVVTPETDPLK